MVKEIQLANNKGVALVDDEDYDKLIKYKWHLRDIKIMHAGTKVKIDGKWFEKRMHHFLVNVPEGFEVDHIDQNGLNNQKSNLRVATHSQNMMNRNSFKGSSSKYKGVSFDKKCNKWRSEVSLNKKHYYLGMFENESDAAMAYNKRALKLHGEYVNLNEV